MTEIVRDKQTKKETNKQKGQKGQKSYRKEK